jgi:hypothetical protein
VAPTTPSAEPHPALVEGRLVLIGPFQVETKGRTFNSLADRVLYWMAHERGKQAATLARFGRLGRGPVQVYR